MRAFPVRGLRKFFDVAIELMADPAVEVEAQVTGSFAIDKNGELGFTAHVELPIEELPVDAKVDYSRAVNSDGVGTYLLRVSRPSTA